MRRRKKRLGDRCTFRGGKNNSVWTRRTRVPEKINGQKTGRFIEKQVPVKASTGMAGQTQKLDLIAQIREAERKCASEQYTPKELALKTEQKKEREEARNAMVASIEKFKADFTKKACHAHKISNCEQCGCLSVI